MSGGNVQCHRPDLPWHPVPDKYTVGVDMGTGKDVTKLVLRDEHGDLYFMQPPPEGVVLVFSEQTAGSQLGNHEKARGACEVGCGV